VGRRSNILSRKSGRVMSSSHSGMMGFSGDLSVMGREVLDFLPPPDRPRNRNDPRPSLQQARAAEPGVLEEHVGPPVHHMHCTRSEQKCL
jgi:hypothetical protein